MTGICRCGEPMTMRAGARLCAHCDTGHPCDKQCIRCAKREVQCAVCKASRDTPAGAAVCEGRCREIESTRERRK